MQQKLEVQYLKQGDYFKRINGWYVYKFLKKDEIGNVTGAVFNPACLYRFPYNDMVVLCSKEEYDKKQVKNRGLAYYTVPWPENFTHIFKTTEENKMSKRLVRVVILDQDDRLRGKLSKHALVYKGEEFVTGLSNEEIVMSLNIGEIIEEHNKVRVTLQDLDASRTLGHEVFLEEIEVSDLQVKVVTLA